VERIGLRGKGVIDGQGAKFTVRPRERPLVGRPFLIRMIECRDVRVEDITLRNSASWTESFLACDNLTIRNIRVHGHVIRNNDGIDIDGCQNVLIEGVESSSDDDGMCFKGTSLRPTKNVVVRNSRFFSYCNALKIGTDSQGAFENIQISNLELGRPPPGTPPLHLGRPEGISGISLEIVDGGTIDRIAIDNIKIVGTLAPIYLVLGDRGRHLQGQPRLPPGALKNVTISNLTAETNSPMGCPIIGLPSHRIEGLLLCNVSISFPGGGIAEDRVRKFPEKADSYPEAIKYANRLPAYGLFFWHVAQVRLENVRLTTRTADQREAIAGEDASSIRIDGRSWRSQ
jgi:polygalacturonase